MIETTPRRVVVLGANGFLGSAVVKHLSHHGHQVTAYWRHSRADIEALPNVRSVVGDIRDTWTLADAIRDADVVYHFASATHPSLFFSDPAAEYSEALQPLIWLIEVAAKNGVKKLVYPSSGGTIYADEQAPRTEASRVDPRSPYAILKLTAEQLLIHSSRQGHFSVDIFRVGNPYGPGQPSRPGQGVIPHWLDSIQSGKPVRVFGDGTAQRDYIFIDDFCKLVALSCQRLEETAIMNLGTGQGTSLNELLAVIKDLANVSITVENLDSRASDIHTIALRPDRLLELHPDFEFTPLKEGLRQTLADRGMISIEEHE